MAFIAFISRFFLVFLLVGGVLAVIRHFLPWEAVKGRKAAAGILLVAALLGYWQGVGAVLGWADSAAQSLKERDYHGVDGVYLLYDFMPVLKFLHAPLPAGVWEAVDRLGDEGAPCMTVQARKLRGSVISPELAAACSAEKERIAAGVAVSTAGTAGTGPGRLSGTALERPAHSAGN
ncbi:MAG: hypothetical protein M0011_01375 [Elusimicrobia bacterium]|nr:hypothetical protein [Elusimicrobiota bacterium]